MFMFRINPIPMEPIVDTSYYKNSRMLRSDLSRRFLATLSTFYWITDFLTLFLSTVLLSLTAIPLLGPLLSPFLSLASSLVNLARALVSAVLTLAVSPLVFLVHSIMSSIKSGLMEMIGGLKIIMGPKDAPEIKSLKDSSLGYSSNLMLLPMGEMTNSNQLYFHPETPYPRSSSSTIHCAICEVSGFNPDSIIPTFNVIGVKAQVANIPQNKEAMEALLRMNMFWATTRLEKTGLVEAVERQFSIK